MVALSGCTGVDGDMDIRCAPTNPAVSISHDIPFNPPPTPYNIDEVSPELTVALSGCTGVDGDMDVRCTPMNPTVSISDDISINQPPTRTPYNIDEVSPELTVALSGCTGVDGDMDVRCTPANPTSSTSDDIPFNSDPNVDNTPELSTIWASRLSAAMDFDSFL